MISELHHKNFVIQNSVCSFNNIRFIIKRNMLNIKEMWNKIEKILN